MDSKEIYDYIIKIQEIAKIGLVCSKDPYALDNYHQINDLSKQFLERFMDVKFDRPNYFIKDQYPTPNISVRTVILNSDKTRVLMVKEVKSQTYSLPGGWCDLYDSPSQAAIKECQEEAGAEVSIIRLVGLLARKPFKDPVGLPEYVVVFQGQINGKLHEHEYETDEVKWCDVKSLPPCHEKVDINEIKRMIKATIDGETIFD